MNRRTALLLLGAVCLFAFVNQSSAQASGDGEQNGNNQNRAADFRKEIERIFDKYGVDHQVRDNILNDIAKLMEQRRKEKESFRKKRRQQKNQTDMKEA